MRDGAFWLRFDHGLTFFEKNSEIFLFFETPDLLRFGAVRASFFSQSRDRFAGVERYLDDELVA